MAGTQPRIVLKHRPWRTTEVEAGPARVFVKRFHDARFPGRAVGRWRDRRRARREARVLQDLAAAGVRVPAVLGIDESEAGVELRLAYVEGARTLDALLELLEAPAELDPRLAAELARSLAALHAAGWVHGDLHARNVLVDPAGDAWIVDAAAIRRTSASRQAHDLVAAAAEARERTSPRFRARFLLTYLRNSSTLRRAEAAALAEALEGAARIHRRERVRAESDRWTRESGVCARHTEGELALVAPRELAREHALAAARSALDAAPSEVVVAGRGARAAWRACARLVEHRVPVARPLALVTSPRTLALFAEPPGARAPHPGVDARAVGVLAGALWDRGLALRRASFAVAADGSAFVRADAGLLAARELARALRPWTDWCAAPEFVTGFAAAQRGSRIARAHLHDALDAHRAAVRA